MSDKWNQTKTAPDNSRFVLLILKDGKEVEAQYIEQPDNMFRTGRQWVDRAGKFKATLDNPAVDYKETNK